MYKRDRALKQQKKALIRSSGFKLESALPLPASPLQSDYSSLPTISKGLLASTPSSVAPTDYEANLYGPSPVGMAVQTHVPLSAQYQYTAFSSRAIKAECPDYTSSSESLTGYPYPDPYPSSSPQPPSLPPLVLELLRCDPDEVVVQNKIVAHLQQEQSGRGRADKAGTFSVMCRMADQTLFSIVEWARSCIFFKELRVSAGPPSVLTAAHTFLSSRPFNGAAAVSGLAKRSINQFNNLIISYLKFRTNSFIQRSVGIILTLISDT